MNNIDWTPALATAFLEEMEDIEKTASAWGQLMKGVGKGLKGAATSLGKSSGGRWSWKVVDGKRVRYLKPLKEGATLTQRAQHLGARAANWGSRNPGAATAVAGTGAVGTGYALG